MSKKKHKDKKEKKVKKDKKGKKGNKEIRQLTGKIAALDDRYQEAQLVLKKVKKKLKQREQIIQELEAQLSLDDFGAEDDLDLAEIMEMEIDSEVLSEQRDAWKRHRYLGEQYTVYLENGLSKPEARQRANRDLIKKYGKDAGHTDVALEEILS